MLRYFVIFVILALSFEDSAAKKWGKPGWSKPGWGKPGKPGKKYGGNLKGFARSLKLTEKVSFTDLSLDLCDLNLDPTDTSVCRAGTDKVVSFFVSPPSETATAIDCPTSPFLVQRKFDCKAEASAWWKPDFPEPWANAKVCYYCFSSGGDKDPNNDEYTLIRTCDTLTCVADATDATMMNLSCNCR